jgi:hypothetical protein
MLMNKYLINMLIGISNGCCYLATRSKGIAKIGGIENKVVTGRLNLRMRKPGVNSIMRCSRMFTLHLTPLDLVVGSGGCDMEHA